MKHVVSGVPVSAVVAAAIGCLQPGIDPVFLTLLSEASTLSPDAHTWIVGATQTGMALGALLIWRGFACLPARTAFSAALVAVAAAVATAFIDDRAALLVVRTVFGFAMGIVYTEAMSRAAARSPTGAYAAVFLTQLLMSTLVAMLLPPVAQALGPRSALLMLVAGPVILAILVAPTRGPGRLPVAASPDRVVPGAAAATAWALAFATFAFICATMAIWSSTAALAIGSGLGADAIGMAVAIGSVAGAGTAIVMMRDRRWIPLPLTGLLAAAGLASPLLLTPMGDTRMFIVAIVLLNIGSTAIIIRCSGAATAAGDGALFRRFVACTHPLGMIAGPAMAAGLTALAGTAGLAAGALASLALGCAALLTAPRTTRDKATKKISPRPLDENRTGVQTST